MKSISVKKSNFIAIAFIFIIMIVCAISENMRGIFIPIFKEEFSVSNTSIGIMLMISSLGYILFSYIGGSLCEKKGQKKVFIMGILFMIGALGILGNAYSFFILLLGMFIMNIGLALMSIATNTLVPVLFISFQAILMNLTHFCYGLGSTVGQRVAGVMIYKGVGWRQLYLYTSILFIIILISFIFIKIPEPHKQKVVKKPGFLQVRKNKLVRYYILALGFYVFAEMGTGSWFVNFIEKNYKLDQSRSSFYLALFFGIFTIGRLVGGFIVERVGYINTVIASLSVAMLLYVIGILTGQNGIMIISISGFFFSIAFPTIVVTVTKVFKENGAYITGVIITFASSISMILNLLIGYLTDKLGPYYSFYSIPISLSLSIWFLLLIYSNTKEILCKN